MTATRTNAPPAPAAMPRPRGGVRRALRRAWREVLIPIAAKDFAAVAGLRAVARSALSWWDVPVERRADVLVILSELATNALMHTDGPLRVRLTCRGGTIRLDIADCSPVPARRQAADLRAETPHGWGLTIAEELADRLTATTSDTGKIGTAEFEVK
jgi:anti-sigma regulatory factor (Ser/Thr protein kinase)